jgi:hypothetical protein
MRTRRKAPLFPPESRPYFPRPTERRPYFPRPLGARNHPKGERRPYFPRPLRVEKSPSSESRPYFPRPVALTSRSRPYFPRPLSSYKSKPPLFPPAPRGVVRNRPRAKIRPPFRTLANLQGEVPPLLLQVHPFSAVHTGLRVVRSLCLADQGPYSHHDEHDEFSTWLGTKQLGFKADGRLDVRHGPQAGCLRTSSDRANGFSFGAFGDPPACLLDPGGYVPPQSFLYDCRLGASAELDPASHGIDGLPLPRAMGDRNKQSCHQPPPESVGVVHVTVGQALRVQRHQLRKRVLDFLQFVHHVADLLL